MCSAHTPLLTFTFCFCSLFYSCARVSHSLLRVPSVVLRLFSLACIGFFPPFPGDSVHTTPSPVSLPPLPSPLRIRLPKRHIVLSPSQSIPLSSARCSLSCFSSFFPLETSSILFCCLFCCVVFPLPLWSSPRLRRVCHLCQQRNEEVYCPSPPLSLAGVASPSLCVCGRCCRCALSCTVLFESFSSS